MNKVEFVAITPLNEFNDSQIAYQIMQQLCVDPKIVQLVQQYNLTGVGSVGELHPKKGKFSKALGVNIKKGQEIKIRLRSHDLTGWRTMDEIMDTWQHELTHNQYHRHYKPFSDLRKKLADGYYNNGDLSPISIYSNPNLKRTSRTVSRNPFIAANRAAKMASRDRKSSG